MINNKLKILKNFLKTSFLIILITSIFFIFIEGLFSTIWIFMKTKPTFAEKKHTQYDSYLGWINIPKIYVKDMYGPGKHLKINAQGFRANQDFAVQKPKGKIRIMCSGDSFVLGYGVGQDDTWCQKISDLDDRIETVNMGQGGYSMGQSYLLYKREGTKLEHDIHLFTFITMDFTRMAFDKAFSFYYRPIVKIDARGLFVENHPVPRNTFRMPFLNANIDTINELRVVKIIRKKIGKVYSGKEHPVISQKQILQSSAGIFQKIQDINRKKKSLLVFVFLPMKLDYFTDDSQVLRIFVKALAEKKGIMAIDLVGDIKKLSRPEVDLLFNESTHYSEKGNQWISEKIYNRLRPILSFDNI